ncbi:MAG: T9SS type A sorting domain-containing protein [Cytophagales bacterium]
MNKITTFLFFVLMGLHSFAQTVKYVNPLATGNGSGTSWANAYTSLKSALASAKDNDEFWLCYSTKYTIDPLQNSVYLVIDKKVSLFGGFKGTETLRSQRTSLQSIISGSIAMSVVDDNSEKAFEIKSNVTLDGIRFTDFYSTETEYNKRVGIVKINDNCTVNFINCDFRNNESVKCIDIANNSNVTVQNTTFATNNRTKGAPVIKTLSSFLTVLESTFQYNGNGSSLIESYKSDTLPNYGEIRLYNSVFNENKGCVAFNTISDMQIANCTIKNDDFYNYTIYHYGPQKKLKVNNTKFSGFFKTMIISFGSLDSVSITNSNFDLSLANNLYVIYGGAKNFRLNKCDFGQFDKSVDPVYLYGADSSVVIKNLQFKDMVRNDNFFYISGKKYINLDSCSFQNITYENGSNLFYLYADTVSVGHTDFTKLSGELFSTYHPYKKFYNCNFKNIKLTSNPIFYQSNGDFVSLVENSVFDSLEIGYSTFANHGYPFIYNGSGSLTLKNNTFRNIKCNDHFIEVGSYGVVKSYGNIFENIISNKGVWQNSGGNVGIYNSNFNVSNRPIFINDDTYSFYPERSMLFVLNSILYSTNDTLVKVVANQTIPVTFLNNYTNKNAGINNYNNSTVTYENIYKSPNVSALFDKGVRSDSTLKGISKDILGNNRLLFSKIDIGCTELTVNPNIVSSDLDNVVTEEFSIYPNPFNETLHVKVDTDAKVKILTTQGQLLITKQLSEGIHPLDLQELKTGVYVVILEKHNASVITKISKN